MPGRRTIDCPGTGGTPSESASRPRTVRVPVAKKRVKRSPSLASRSTFGVSPAGLAVCTEELRREALDGDQHDVAWPPGERAQLRHRVLVLVGLQGGGERLALHAQLQQDRIRAGLRDRAVEAVVVELVAPECGREAEQPVARELVGIGVAARVHLVHVRDGDAERRQRHGERGQRQPSGARRAGPWTAARSGAGGARWPAPRPRSPRGSPRPDRTAGCCRSPPACRRGSRPL